MDRVLLVGDSILDNSYWPGNGPTSPQVGCDCTGDVLLANGVDVYNHAVEETKASDWYKYGGEFRKTVNPNASKVPPHSYFKSVRALGVKTSYKGSSYGQPVLFFPDLQGPFNNLTVVISCIGNDIFLSGEWLRFLFDVDSLIDRLIGIFRAYKERYPGCRVVYVFPYRPVKLLGIETTGIAGAILDYKVDYVLWRLGQIPQLLDSVLNLTKLFTCPEHYSATAIPEPTREGAKRLAQLIMEEAQRK